MGSAGGIRTFGHLVDDRVLGRGRIVTAIDLEQAEERARAAAGHALDEALAAIAAAGIEVGAAARPIVDRLLCELDERGRHGELSDRAAAGLGLAHLLRAFVAGAFYDYPGLDALRAAGGRLGERDPLRAEVELWCGRAAIVVETSREQGFEELASAELRAERAGDPRLDLEVKVSVGVAEFFWGRWDDSLRRLGEASLLAGRLGDRAGRVESDRIRVRVLGWRGDLAGADRILSRTRPWPSDSPLWRADAATALALNGDLDVAVPELAAVADARDADPTARMNALTTMTYVAAAERDDDLASRVITTARTIEGDEVPIRCPRELCIAALCGDVESASAQLPELTAAPTVVATQARFAAAIAADRAGERRRAVELATSARRSWEVMDARCGVELANRVIRANGVRPPATSVARELSGWASLTDAESRVVALVADGLTYAEIGEELQVSRRTVESHVAHARAKVGARSRAELAAAYLRDRD